MAERLTPLTLDLEIRDSSLARRFVSLKKQLYSTLSLFTQVYKWVPAIYCWGWPYDGLVSRPGGSSNTLRHVSCYGNRYKLRSCGPLARERLCLTFSYSSIQGRVYSGNWPMRALWAAMRFCRELFIKKEDQSIWTLLYHLVWNF